MLELVEGLISAAAQKQEMRIFIDWHEVQNKCFKFVFKDGECHSHHFGLHTSPQSVFKTLRD